MRYLILPIAILCLSSPILSKTPQKKQITSPAEKSQKNTVKANYKPTLDEFYEWLVAHRRIGLPTLEEQKNIEGLLSKKLKELLSKAKQYETRCLTNEQKNQSSFKVEGDIFSGNFFGVERVLSYDKVIRDGNKIYVHVVLQDTQPPSKLKKAKWTDKIELILEKEKWVINNISLYNDNRGSILLSDELTTYIEETTDVCSAKKKT